MKLPHAGWTLAATLLSLALASCGSPEPTTTSSPSPPPAATPAVSPTPVESLKPEIAVARSLNAFGLDLHRVLAAENPNANLLISPYALGSGLAMLSCGAEGETLAEFRKVLHLPEEEVMLKGFEELNSRLQPEPSKTDAKEHSLPEYSPFLMATRLYGQTGFDYNTDFLGKLNTAFRTNLEGVDFANEPGLVREKINSWISDKTNGQIGSLLPEGAINSYTRFSLVTGVNFAARWLDEFEPENTKPAAFHVSKHKQVMVPTMLQGGNLRYHVGDGFKAVEKRYRSDPPCRFLVCVPDERDGLLKMEQKLSESFFMDSKAFRKDETKIIFYLPKFTFQGSTQTLSKPMKKLGLYAPFDPLKEGSFSRLTKIREPFFLQEMHQQGKIRVYEKGAEVTLGYESGGGVAGIPLKPPPCLIIRADRPFLFAIQEVKTGALLFLGRVTDPR